MTLAEFLNRRNGPADGDFAARRDALRQQPHFSPDDN